MVIPNANRHFVDEARRPHGILCLENKRRPAGDFQRPHAMARESHMIP